MEGIGVTMEGISEEASVVQGLQCEEEEANDENGLAGASPYSSSEEEKEEEESSEDEDEDDVNDENAHLSDYERLRLSNIKRNEARLKKLGLGELKKKPAGKGGKSSQNPKKQVSNHDVVWVICDHSYCFSPQHSTAAEEEAECHHSEEKHAAQTLQVGQVGRREKEAERERERERVCPEEKNPGVHAPRQHRER